MARNEEKAMAMLNRWVTMKSAISKGIEGREARRPRLTTDCGNLRDAEHWRRDLVRRVSRNIAEIQNAGLGEHRIRDLNDEINKELRIKARWEDRIKELGGPDYKASAPKIVDAYGTELSGQGGYKYFGAARDLPGVRELFEREVHEAPKRTRAQMFRGITPDYYGWRDEDDRRILPAERAREEELVAEEVKKWNAEKRKRDETIVDKMRIDSDNTNNTTTRAYVVVPTAEDIQKLLLEKKKQLLMSKYTSNELQQSVDDASALMGN
eukprot:GHVL01044306.1.p1 GENE.GHVL01044306.1~~GHVL01044306.1.p1  ORF type:complete len:267 (-),score=45.99 GHVL01044306.1:3156-3956(-)